MIQCLTSLSFPFGIYIVVIETWHQPGCLAYANEMEREKQRVQQEDYYEGMDL